MTVRFASLIASSTLIACCLAFPALATPHSGKLGHGGPKSVDKRVLLLSGSHDRGLHLGFFPWSARFDLREMLRQQRERRHELLMAWLQRHHKPVVSGTPGGGTGSGEGGGVVLPPVGTPGGGTEVPMPEPGAALLFALGTGIVATYLRRPQTA
jgi:hypothetical protein